MDKNDAKDFQAVLYDELEALDKPGATANLTGLAFSGGGIRSATFNLGIIQALAGKNLLGKFDYLSTVSGGGYIGSWLSAQIHRHADATKQKTEGFQNSLNASLETGAEPASIKWLRSYSNYLTPRKGLSGDTLAAIGTWLRNTLLNQATLALFFMVLILLAQLLLLTFNNTGLLEPLHSGSWLLLSVLLVSGATLLCAISLPKLCCYADSQHSAASNNEERQQAWKIILIAVLAAYSLSMWMYSTSFWTSSWMNTNGQSQAPSLSLSLLKNLAQEFPFMDVSGQISSPLLTALNAYWSPIVIAVTWALIYALPWIASLIYSLLKPESSRCANPGEQPASSPLRFAFGAVMSALVAGAFGGWLIYLLSHVIARQDEALRLWWAAGFGTPLLLLIFCLILVLHQGLMARLFRVSQMEWWARLGGYALLVAAAWAGIHVLLIYAPPLLNMLEDKFIAAGGLVWAAHSLSGVVLGKGADTAGKDSTRWKEWITRAAPYVFVLGYLVAVSWAVHALMHRFGTANTPHKLNLFAPNSTFSDFLTHALQINNSADIAALCYVLTACGIAFLILAWRLDVNLFSIHHFYRNRLTRCYLGAGRVDRVANPFTGFDPCDDIRLAELKQRPLHLVNTALNLVHNGNLAWQDRKAFSFTFSPVACGFQYPPNAAQQGGGYYDSAQYMGGVRLGTAMAASGAAASPSMGYHSSPAVAFLLTVFNVRLGHWCPNTAAHAIKPGAIRRESPAIGGEYLLKELFSLTNDDNAFVYLSDGGHFENLGVYELVRRRCRYIMAVDAGQDEERNFEDLANMLRKCYIDFGVKIDINLDALRPDKDGNCPGCYTLGDITYPPEKGQEQGGSDKHDNWGVLLYIKPSLLKDIPEGIRQYAKTNPGFPHQTTADQFFDEAQFESYRHLGNFLMDKVLDSISQEETQKKKTWSWVHAPTQ